MTEHELKKLNRAELLTMLMSVTQRCDDLEEELAATKKQLADRNIEIEQAGSMAEAALKINGVMQAADEAAAQYLENVKRQTADQEAAAQTLMNTTRQRCQEIENETRLRCSTMISNAKTESQTYWDEVYGRLTQYCETTDALKGLLKQFQGGQA